MKTASWQWLLHRAILSKVGWLRPFSGGTNRKRWLFISERDPICHTQIFPYFFHAKDFAKRFGIEIRELPLSRFKEGKHPYQGRVDAVAFQTWFDVSPEELSGLTQQIQQTWPMAKLAYFDWFAPTDLRYAETLNPAIAAYVKKQAFKDFGQYEQPTLGDTNLTDYYAKRFGLDLPLTHFKVPEGFKDKLFVSPHFAYSDHMIPYFLATFPGTANRGLDLHARIAVKGTEWYTKMRQESLDRVLALEDRLKVVCKGRVSRDEYFKELFNAKVCFSPFGYGEVCWRDFEAMFTGSLLLKPDMSHLACYPEAFFPDETYVSLAWDLSDFEEKVECYLKDDRERERIARNAFELMQNYFRNSPFVEDTRPLLQTLGLET